MDPNGDGVADVVAGGTGCAVAGCDPGRVRIAFGRTSMPVDLANALTIPNPLGVDISGFGFWVANAGDVDGDGYGDIVIGAPLATTNVGFAEMILGGPTALTPTAMLRGPAGTTLSYGVTAAGVGDVNHDGYADVVVGAWASTVGAGQHTGNVFLYRGSPAGLDVAHVQEIDGPDGAGGQFGAVGRVGDLNGDGFDDVIVGAACAPATAVGAGFSCGSGRAYVYLGESSGLHTPPMFRIDGPPEPGAQFGARVAGGDWNGDGAPDLAVSAVYASARSGRTFVYATSHAAVPSTSTVILSPSTDAQGQFGSALANGGDLNGDGIDDLLVGESCGPYDVVMTTCGPGRIYEFLGHTSGFAAVADLSLLGEHEGDAFGQSIDGPGDTDGDGFDDAIVGASCGWMGTPSCNGVAYIYPSSASGLVNMPTRWYGNVHESFGWSVARAFVRVRAPSS
jgi:hypothetical protein